MKEPALETKEEELFLLGGRFGSQTTPFQCLLEHDRHILCVVLAGKGRLTLGQQKYDLKKEEIFVLYPETRAKLKGEALRLAWIHFAGCCAGSYLSYAGFSPERPVQHSYIPCETYLSQIEDMLQLPGFGLHQRLLQTSALYNLFSTLVDAQRVEGRAGVARYDYPREVYVQTLKEHIEQQYPYVQISGLAKYLGINRSYLTVIFKKETGISPQKYLMNFRMEKAAELLLSSDAPLKEIARRTGYADPFTFSKTFKSQFGISPSVYRKSKGGE